MALYRASNSGDKGREVGRLGREVGGGREGGMRGPARYIIIIRAFSAAARRLLLSSPPNGGRMWLKGSRPGIPPGREGGPNGEGKGSSLSCDEESRKPLANGLDSIFNFVINWF